MAEERLNSAARETDAGRNQTNKNYFSSRANPPAGAFAAALLFVAVMSFFSTWLVDAKVKESVTTAAPAIKRIIFDFMGFVF